MPDSAHLSRRAFLAAVAALGAAAALPGCGGGSSGGDEVLDKTTMYRLSTRGQRASNAAKANAANKLFATAADAEAGRAHPGDKARVVPLDTKPETWDLLFQDGARRVIDLRNA